tara:strand:+ start:3089 stop:4084 length:996 start_codon:yes stop_codon:yes gene_type:complete
MLILGGQLTLSSVKGGLVKPQPSHSNVRYGPDKRNVLDLWIPESAEPVPLLIFFHGGGFKQGGKQMIMPADVKDALANGIAIASVQYQFVHRDGLGDPERAGVQDVLRSSARAVQFLRHHSESFGIDKTRVACFGESAGAGTSLWIAAHDDLADPSSSDPVERESTRILAAGLTHCQFTYDLSKWIPEFSRRFGGGIKMFDSVDHAAFFGLTSEQYRGPEGVRGRAEADMISHLSPDDPPLMMVSFMSARKPLSLVGFSHHPLHVELVQARCAEVNVEMTALIPKERPEDGDYVKNNPSPVMAFLVGKLKPTEITPAESGNITIQALPVEE